MVRRMISVPLPLTTPRLLLRPYEAGDEEALHDLLRREDVCRYLPWEPMDRDEARLKLEQRVLQDHIEMDGDPLVLAAVERATGRTVGELMVRLRRAQRGVAPGHGTARDAPRGALRRQRALQGGVGQRDRLRPARGRVARPSLTRDSDRPRESRVPST